MTSTCARQAACAAILMLIASEAAAGARQPTRPELRRRDVPVQTPAQDVVAPRIDTRDARETRDGLMEVLRHYPPSVSQVLRLDPSLLTKADYIATYPLLSAFLAQHPEIAHNPAYFLGDVRAAGFGWESADPRSEAVRMWRNVMEGFMIFVIILTIAFALGWLVRTLVDHRRWLRLSKVQTEAHTKLLDRFSSNEDLLTYIQSSAGRRFLEAAPIPVDAGPRAMSAPIGRILWSVQAGFVLALGGLALMWVSFRVGASSPGMAEVATPLFVIGVLAVGLGAGFVVSAAVAYGLSRRLGLLESPTRTEA